MIPGFISIPAVDNNDITITILSRRHNNIETKNIK